MRASAASHEVSQLYEHIDYRHASDIVMASFPSETLEICSALLLLPEEKLVHHSDRKP